MKLFSKIKDNPLLSFLIGLLTLAFGAFVGVLFCECIEIYISKLLGSSNKNETLKFLGISMGGILIALQALMSYILAKAMEDTAQAQADAANAQARATEEQAKANQHTEQGQRQERFRNAIEHLGHESDSVRLGGAYELFHLAKDTLAEDPKEKLSQTVLDILCAHIRRTTGEDKYREKHKSQPSEEVQSLLTLLFVQEYEVFRGCHINLQGSWLNGADLRETRLWKAALVGAHLQKADLHRAHLQKANLCRAQLQGANLVEAQLQGTTLDRAQLQRSILNRAQLQGANLVETQLQGSILAMAQLQGANLVETRLQAVNLVETQLQGAMLFLGIQLQGAALQRARLQGIGSVDGSSMSFQDRIRRQIDKESDLSEVISAGGLSQKYVDSLVEGLSEDQATWIRGRLRRYIDTPESHELPENSGAITGSYTKEDAETWIAEYEKAMSEVPADDS